MALNYLTLIKLPFMNLSRVLFALLTVVTLIISCSKLEDFNALQANEEISSATNGDRLSFATLEDFLTALEKYSDTEHKQVQLSEIKQLEQEFDFKSMRSKFEKLSEQYENIETEEELEKFVSEHPEIIVKNQNGIFLKPFLDSYSFMNLLAEDGTVEISGILYKFTNENQIIIVDGDESKLPEAIQELKTNEEKGIFVIPGWSKHSLTFRDNCGTGLECQSPQISDRRVEADWGMNLTAIPNRNQFGQVTSWTISYTFDVNVYAQRRKAFGRWGSTQTFISHVSNGEFEADRDLFSPTSISLSWTTSAQVSKINIHQTVMGPKTFAGSTIPNGVHNFFISTCLCGAEYEDVDSYCFACCGVDCSNLGDSDIPQ